MRRATRANLDNDASLGEVAAEDGEVLANLDNEEGDQGKLRS